jgi:hypothetical protein
VNRRSFLFLFLLLLGCAYSDAREKYSDRVWIVVRPLQCLANPWEKDWLAKTKKQPDQYPQMREGSVIRKFFARNRVPVLEIRMQPYRTGDPICQTCACPRGDTLFLLIKANDVPKMVQLGYTHRVPAQDVPEK